MNELIKVENGLAILDPATASDIAQFERVIKAMQDEEAALKQKILLEMQSKNIFKLETPELSITYVAPTYRETFDSKSFRQANPALYDEYVKISPVNGSVRLKLK